MDFFILPLECLIFTACSQQSFHLFPVQGEEWKHTGFGSNASEEHDDGTKVKMRLTILELDDLWRKRVKVCGSQLGILLLSEEDSLLM